MKEIFIIFILTFNGSNCKELPSSWRNFRCPLTHDFKECFIEKGNAAIPFIAQGDKEYNLPKLNPYKVPLIQLVSTPSMSLNLTHVKVYGLETLKITDIEVDLKTRMFRTTLKAENITFSGDYSVNGKILVLPLVSRGTFSIVLENGTYVATKIDYIVKKEGEIYYNPVFDPLEYTMENVKIRINDLFKENQGLGNTVNEFLNENWRILMLEFGPEIANVFWNVIKQIFDNLASRVPLKNVFLDDPVYKFRK